MPFCRVKIFLLRHGANKTSPVKNMKFIKNVRLYDKTTDIGIENGKIAFIGKTDECGKDFGGLKI